MNRDWEKAQTELTNNQKLLLVQKRTEILKMLNTPSLLLVRASLWSIKHSVLYQASKRWHLYLSYISSCIGIYIFSIVVQYYCYRLCSIYLFCTVYFAAVIMSFSKLCLSVWSTTAWLTALLKGFLVCGCVCVWQLPVLNQRYNTQTWCSKNAERSLWKFWNAKEFKPSPNFIP